jgi:protein TonB
MRFSAALLLCLLIGIVALAQESKPSAPRSLDAAIAKKNLMTFVQPEYPPLAKIVSITGKVRAEIVVDKAGNVASVKFLSGHPMLAPAAIRAIREWKYKPFEIDGAQTEITTEVEVSIPGKHQK